MTTKDWLVEINKWLRKNGYDGYAMKKMTTKEWGLLKRFMSKVQSMERLTRVLNIFLDEKVLMKVPLLSTYSLACVDGMMGRLLREEAEKKIKEQLLSAPGEKVRAWAKDKREHPEKYRVPKITLDRKTAT
jgi:hypothetical protein